jgi:hypothetical protein
MGLLEPARSADVNLPKRGCVVLFGVMENRLQMKINRCSAGGRIAATGKNACPVFGDGKRSGRQPLDCKTFTIEVVF